MSRAEAAALTQVTDGDWKGGDPNVPDYVSLYVYVPDDAATKPPILVCLHNSGSTATGYFTMPVTSGGVTAAADLHGFIMIFPQTSNNGWDAGTSKSLSHTADLSDSYAITKAVSYSVTAYGANAERVYIAGTSIGGVMAEAMLAVYPEVFKGGVIFGGAPAGCWADDYASFWSSPCASGNTLHTPQEWGDLARAMYPTYSASAPRPRVKRWHGGADSTLLPVLLDESVDQWTNVLGLGAAESGTPTAERRWVDSCGNTVLDAWIAASATSSLTNINMQASEVIPFLALDNTDAVDPVVAGCSPGGTGGGGGMGGTGGTAGMSGTGGASNGGSGNTGGSNSNGGSGDTTGNGGSGDTTSNGGTGDTGGTPSSGGSPSNGAGAAVNGGTNDSGGSAGDGEVGASAGTAMAAMGGSSAGAATRGGSGGAGAATANGGTGLDGLGGSSMSGAAMGGAADPSLRIEREHACLCGVPVGSTGDALWSSAALAGMVAATLRRRRRALNARKGE